MTRKHLILLVLFIVLAAVFATWRLLQSTQAPNRATGSVEQSRAEQQAPSSGPHETGPLQPLFKTLPTEQERAEKLEDQRRAKEAQEKAFLNAFNTPFDFWGKVIDQYGKPVEGANVRFSANDKYWERGSKFTTQSDHRGLFSLRNAKGISLNVDVEKVGYYRNPKSYASFKYHSRPSATERPIPTEQNPAIFVLRKMGQVVPLIRMQKFVKVPRDGAPIEISMETGRVVPAGEGHLRVEAWTDDQNKDSQGHYNWKCRISVPNGGLIGRTDNFAFEAPAGDYVGADEIVMAGNTERWNPQASRQYFVKLPDNRYARIEFEMIAGGDHFFSITSYLNPEPGSRNLEYDPSKKIQ